MSVVTLNPGQSINAGMNSAGPNGIVNLTPGTYPGLVNITAPITIQSTTGKPSDVIIDGQGGDSGSSIGSGGCAHGGTIQVNAKANLKGFTARGSWYNNVNFDIGSDGSVITTCDSLDWGI